MLPIFRTVSVGGVLLAITILALALIPPSRSHIQLAGGDMPARGVLIDPVSHPEWRQFLIVSALRRADEVEKLRDLPGMPNGAPEPPPAIAEPAERMAGLPSTPAEVAPEDETGSINVAPSATIPIDIGETSSFELPIGTVEEKPPVASSPVVSTTPPDTMPVVTIVAPVTSDLPTSRIITLSPLPQAKPVVFIRKRPAVHKPAPKAATTKIEVAKTPPPFNIFEAFLASLAGKQAAVVKPAEPPKKSVSLRRPHIKPRKTASAR